MRDFAAFSFESIRFSLCVMTEAWLAKCCGNGSPFRHLDGRSIYRKSWLEKDDVAGGW